MKNKLITIILVFVSAISLLGIIAVVVLMNYTGDSADKEPSIDEVIKYSVEIPEITTNLTDNTLIRVTYMMETDGKKAKEELEKRIFQVNDIVIKELSEMKAEQLNDKKGKLEFENKLKEQVNELMQEGKVIQVYTTSSILQ
jgi:flagellar FliL protein